jgi:hypothetical protein
MRIRKNVNVKKRVKR